MNEWWYWFVSNLASGLGYSLIPLALFAPLVTVFWNSREPRTAPTPDASVIRSTCTGIILLVFASLAFVWVGNSANSIQPWRHEDKLLTWATRGFRGLLIIVAYVCLRFSWRSFFKVFETATLRIERRKADLNRIPVDVFVSRMTELAGLKKAGIFTKTEIDQRKRALIQTISENGVKGSGEAFLLQASAFLEQGLLSRDDMLSLKSSVLRPRDPSLRRFIALRPNAVSVDPDVSGETVPPEPQTPDPRTGTVRETDEVRPENSNLQSVRTRCVHCSTQLEFEGTVREWIGHSVECPNCGKSTEFLPPALDRATRLQDLKKSLAAGLIGEEDYRRKRNAIIDEMPNA